LVDDSSQVVEVICEAFASRHVGLPEARQIWRYQAKSIREERYQISEHVTGAWESMQEEQSGCFLLTRFAIEDLDSTNIYRAVSNDSSDNRSILPFLR